MEKEVPLGSNFRLLTSRFLFCLIYLFDNYPPFTIRKLREAGQVSPGLKAVFVITSLYSPTACLTLHLFTTASPWVLNSASKALHKHQDKDTVSYFRDTRLCC